jgi:hypothetical protein
MMAMLTNCQGQGCGGTRPATSLGRAPRTCDIEDAGGQAVAVWCRDATGTLADSAVGTNVFFPRPGVGTVAFLATGRSHCQLSGIEKVEAPQRIGVRCLRPGRDPVDSRFHLTYAR